MATQKYTIFAKRALTSDQIQFCEIKERTVTVWLKDGSAIDESFHTNEKAQQIFRDLEKFTRKAA